MITKERKVKIEFRLWFPENKLGNDYGIFYCDLCRDSFFHSPCSVHSHQEQLTDCTCGKCANRIAGNHRVDKPYTR